MAKVLIFDPKKRKGPALQMQDVRLACGENFNKRELAAIEWTIQRANELIEAPRHPSSDLSALYRHLKDGGKAIGIMPQMLLPMNKTHSDLDLDVFLEHWNAQGLKWLSVAHGEYVPSHTEELQARIAELEKALKPFADFVFNPRSAVFQTMKHESDAVVLCGYDDEEEGKTTGIDVRFSDFDAARLALGLPVQKVK
jgi:hypothetical protein